MNEEKRKLEEAEEKQAGAKKQKNDVPAAVEEKKSKVKTSETEVLKSYVLFPPTKELLVAAEKGPVDLFENKIKPDDGLISEDKISSAEDAGAPEKVPGTATKSDLVAVNKKKGNVSNGSGSFSEDGEVAATKSVLAAVSSGEDATATEKEGESRSIEESEEADLSNFKGIKKSISGSEDSSSLEESPEEDEEVSTDKEAEASARNPEKMNTDVKMLDATTPNLEKGGSLNVEAPKTSATLRDQTTGPKTLFLGNLCFSIERTDVEEFFKDVGELVDVRFAMNKDDTFRGFGHIEFATAEAAEKALRELNGKHLLGRRVRLDFIREKGSYTQHSGTETSSHQTARKAQGKTIFIRGFDKRPGEDKIRSALGDLFVSCGEITNISIPIDQDGGIKGIAYIDFKDADAFNNALELNGSEFGEATLTVEVARHRGDGRDIAWSGRSFGGRFGGRHGDSRGYGGHFGGSGHGYGGGDSRGYGGHFGGSGHGYGGGHFGGGGHGYGGHFGGGGRGYGGHFGGSGSGYTGRFGGNDRGYSGWFASGGRGW